MIAFLRYSYNPLSIVPLIFNNMMSSSPLGQEVVKTNGIWDNRKW